MFQWNERGTCRKQIDLSSSRLVAEAKKGAEQRHAMLAGDALGMELDAVNRRRLVAHAP